MTDGVSLGWLPLLIAALAYVLKRWWDSTDALLDARRRAYSAYYTAAYEVVRRDTEAKDSQPNEIIEAVARLHDVTPDFYLHASPVAIMISDEFCRRFQVGHKDAAGADLHQSLNVLREVLKSELYFFMPRFAWERAKYRRRWKKFVRENKT